MKKLMIVSVLSAVLLLSACSTDNGATVDRTNEIDDTTEVATVTTSDSDNEGNGGGQTDTGSEADTTEQEPDRERILAPDFTLLNKEGEEVSLSDYRGKIVFLNFFTTWCTYCEIEMPDFQEASEKYADDVEFLIIDVFPSENIDEAGVYEWYESRGFTMEMLIDKDGDLQQFYPVQGFPTTFFIDREGYVIAYYPGAMTPEVIDDVVEQFR